MVAFTKNLTLVKRMNLTFFRVICQTIVRKLRNFLGLRDIFKGVHLLVSNRLNLMFLCPYIVNIALNLEIKTPSKQMSLMGVQRC